MIDHVFLTVSDMDRSVDFYSEALTPLGIGYIGEFDGKTGPEGHPDLKGFGSGTDFFLWLREGVADSRAAHIGLVATTHDQVDATYAAAIAAGATDNGAPGDRTYYGPRYYAANVLDPDGYSLEFVHKNWLDHA
jgi:catechol 2,3-dioxygenase-like lactoylglutathione lyase family enzyme